MYKPILVTIFLRIDTNRPYMMQVGREENKKGETIMLTLSWVCCSVCCCRVVS